jgi:hypothetical protein
VPLVAVPESASVREHILHIDLGRPCDPTLSNEQLFAKAQAHNGTDMELKVRELLGGRLLAAMGIRPGAVGQESLLPRLSKPEYRQTATSCGYSFTAKFLPGQLGCVLAALGPVNSHPTTHNQLHLSALPYNGFDNTLQRARLTLCTGRITTFLLKLINLPAAGLNTVASITQVVTACLRHKYRMHEHASLITVTAVHSVFVNTARHELGVEDDCYNLTVEAPFAPVGDLDLHWSEHHLGTCTATVRLDHAVSARSPLPPDAHLARSGAPATRTPVVRAPAAPAHQAPASPCAARGVPTASASTPEVAQQLPSQPRQQPAVALQPSAAGPQPPVASASGDRSTSTSDGAEVAMEATAGPLVGFRRRRSGSGEASTSSSGEVTVVGVLGEGAGAGPGAGRDERGAPGARVVEVAGPVVGTAGGRPAWMSVGAPPTLAGAGLSWSAVVAPGDG